MTAYSGGTPTPMTPDERYEIAAVAAAAERGNRPRHLLIIGAIAMVVATVALLVGLNKNNDAASRLRSTSREIHQIEQLAAQLAQLEAVADTGPSIGITEPIPTLLSQIEDLARRAGIQGNIPIPRGTSPEAHGNYRRLTYPYKITDETLSEPIQWVRLALTEIPGLGLDSIEIRPTGTTWTVEVKFFRFESVQ